MMNLQFSGEIWYWRGPSPFHFVTIPQEESNAIKAISSMVTYGWGVISVRVTIGETTYTTSLFPKEGKYLVPIKADVRKAEDLDLGDVITLQVEIG